MSNIIEERIKLNMKTETREERTLKTPMVVDGMRQGLLLPWNARQGPLLLHKVAPKDPLYGGMNMLRLNGFRMTEC